MTAAAGSVSRGCLHAGLSRPDGHVADAYSTITISMSIDLARGQGDLLRYSQTRLSTLLRRAFKRAAGSPPRTTLLSWAGPEQQGEQTCLYDPVYAH